MKTKLALFLMIVFCALILFLGNWGLTDSSEARYAQISKEIVVSGDYITPTLLNIKHLHKPPVTYYLTALGYKLFGINEFGARFFMQLALIIQLLLVFNIAQILYKNERISFLTSLIYFSFPISIIAVRTLTTDAYLSTFILASIYFWLRFKMDRKYLFLYLFYIFLGITFETKGPVGLLVPVSFILSYKIIFKEKISTSIHQFIGFGAFLLISLSWYLAIALKNEGLIEYFIEKQLIERVSKNTFLREKSFWFYFVMIPLLGFPWVIFLVNYFKNQLKFIVQEKKTDFILLITFLVMFITLSISTSKLILYILPVFFILAIFTAKYLTKCSTRIIKSISITYFIITLLLTTGVFVISFLNFDYNIDFKAALTVFIAFNLASMLILKKLKNSNFFKPAYLGVIFIISLIISSTQLFKNNELKFKSVKPIAEFIQKNCDQEATVIVYNYLLPSLSFYLNQDIITINGGRDTTTREVDFETNENWKETLYNYSDENDRIRLSKLKIENPTFLIRRFNNKFPDTLQNLADKLKNRKDFEKFVVYY